MSQKIPLYNPLNRDFSYKWLDDNNDPHILTMKAGEITYFPPDQVNFIKKHLADEILNERGIKTNWEDDFNAILKEIEVDL